MEHTLNQLHINKNKYNILLSHRPEAFNAYSDFNLILSGHAHGGQFRIPLIGGIIAPGQGFSPKYDAGEYKKRTNYNDRKPGDRKQYCPGSNQ